MKFGMFDHIDRRDEPPADIYKGRLALAQAAEKAGFYGYHLAEHHWTPLGMAPSPSAFLGAVAMTTSTIKLGPMVYLLPLYHPLRLIEEICMLDQMSNGRLQFGVGRGVSPFEVGYYNVNVTESYAQFREALDVVLAGLTSETLTHHGTYWNFNEVPMEMKPLQAPYPPLWAGAGAPSSQEFCARMGCNIVALGPNEAAKRALDTYRELWPKFAKERKQANSPVETPFYGTSFNLLVTETDEEAERIGRPAFKHFIDSLTKLWIRWRAQPAFIGSDFDAARKAGVVIAGSPATVRETLEERLSVTGADYAMSEIAWGNLGHEAEMRSLELYAAEVMPHFNGKK